ncbi:MAG TPA: diadenylate cyclase CdaA [Pyrinomonadaceae bacterium]|jgi:diadenylate cyclase|nr:TIGR00159 family protein [Chloracidobacterium sp.]MBP9935051.1 diadenylate cyclase CdaA [Pyrinomonadaceae bacterium]MBK7801323.1 TIGR00159 family protein [Chloracidobacterium sp.]MBK9436646.1 TIGR00159 family protein [Chloracidobacterium sp.]MBK9766267.1 TIGR00159 family protein [Chloracidobacterium sp.]
MQFIEYISAISSVRNVIDIVLVFIIVYVVLKLLRGTRAVPTVVGMVLLGLLYWLASVQGLSTLEFVLRYAVVYIGIAIIVLFQSEIRQALIYFANRFRFPLLRRQRGQFGGSVYDEIVLAITTLASEKTGALIVIERNIGLRNFIDAGVQLDARLSYDLLVTIFNPSTPLHDGAVIIQSERLAAASVFLPLTKNPEISRDLGTRHRAAIGITEGSDAISLVVSEETGLITYVEAGNVRRNLDPTTLRKLLLEAMDIPLIERKKDAANALKEADTEVTIG